MTIVRTLCITIAASTAIRAQATYAEAFDEFNADIPLLQSRGWEFRHQGVPYEVTLWSGTPDAHSGGGYLLWNDIWQSNQGGQLSSWVLLPAVPAQVAGDVLSFVLRGINISADSVLEVRYSPSGGTGTGSGAADIGDFATLLHTVHPAPSAPWSRFDVTIPGPGRIAFRAFDPTLPTAAGYSPGLFFDTLGFNVPPPPPMPLPGQTLHWTTSMNPVRVPESCSVPATATLVIDAGVRVEIAAGAVVEIAGTLQAFGSRTNPIALVGADATATVRTRDGGAIALGEVAVDVAVNPRLGSRLVASDCTFRTNGTVVNAYDYLMQSSFAFVRLDRCTFAGATLQLDQTVTALRHTGFQQPTSPVIVQGYALLDDVAVDGEQLWLAPDKRPLQPRFVDGVRITNNPSAAALHLQGGAEWLLGSQNSLVGNGAPVEFGVGSGGLLPGTIVPPTGNALDRVLDTDDWDPQHGRVRWAPLAVPYRVRMPHFTGHLELLPGVQVEFDPNTNWLADSFGDVRARGTADRPIVLRPTIPGTLWGGIGLIHPEIGQRWEHVHVFGANYGADTLDAQMDSCRFVGCRTGLWARPRGWIVARGCDVADSVLYGAAAAGRLLLGSTSNPNSITGSLGVGYQGFSNTPGDSAEGTWWGDATGPTTPRNPGGRGDSLVGALATFQPFAATVPDRRDAPPHVRAMPLVSGDYEAGARVVFQWQANDDDAIVAQRVLFSPATTFPSRFTTIAQLDGEERWFEYTLPYLGTSGNGSPASLRIEATDSSGQVGWDEWVMHVSDPTTVPGTVTLANVPTGTWRIGDRLPLDFTTSGIDPVQGPRVDMVLFNDGDGRSTSLGGVSWNLGTGLTLTMPDLSTDSARIGISISHSLNLRRWSFTAPFAIRPDAQLGDQPPTVQLLSPLADDTWFATRVLPIRWSASDDEAIRSFDLQISYDGGRSWWLLAGDLPPTARAFDWRVPAVSTFADTRIRVVAHDLRFQTSSDGAASSFRILGGACQQSLGLGSPPWPRLDVCGMQLASGGSATALLSFTPAHAPVAFAVASTLNPIPLLGGTLHVNPPSFLGFTVATANGQAVLGTVPGGGGPYDLFLQGAALDIGAARASFSNVVHLRILP